jgi:hypothetical protein
MLDKNTLQAKIKELIPEEYSFIYDLEFGELETHRNPLTGNNFIYFSNIALFEDKTGEISGHINTLNRLTRGNKL